MYPNEQYHSNCASCDTYYIQVEPGVRGGCRRCGQPKEASGWVRKGGFTRQLTLNVSRGFFIVFSWKPTGVRERDLKSTNRFDEHVGFENRKTIFCSG